MKSLDAYFPCTPRENGPNQAMLDVQREPGAEQGVFGFVGIHQCFKSNACSYRKPVEGV